MEHVCRAAFETGSTSSVASGELAGTSRRMFLKRGIPAVAAGAALAASRLRGLQAQQAAESQHGRVRIIDIESHEIMVDYEDFVARELQHFYGPTRRTIHVVRTSNGEIGLGEGDGEPPGVIERYIGTSPFDWINDETSLSLGTAMYDLMGKLAGVPVYKLFGQRHRAFVPVACWHVSTHPQRLAEVLLEYSSRGYTWLKYHLSPFENVLDQMRAMQQVAPPGFRIHHDLTMGGTSDHVFELLDQISAFPIAGCFEDPLPEKDIEGYVELRNRCRLPILYHHAPLNATFETLRRAADGYILGHARISEAVRRAGLFGALELPFSLQNIGGTITRAMTVHMQAAFRTAWLHFNSDTESWKSDVVQERLNPVNGLIRVSEKPGLGVTLDPAELERLKKLKLPAQKPWIIRSRLAGGARMYNLANPAEAIFMVRPDHRREITLSYAAPVETDYWDDDGSAEFTQMKQRIEREGTVLVGPE